MAYIAKFKNPETNETAQWQEPRFLQKCAAGSKCLNHGMAVTPKNKACLIKGVDGWKVFHPSCAPSWAHNPKLQTR